MPIVASRIVLDARQRDGRRRIEEAHIDHLGVVHPVSYLGEAGVDAAAALTARAGQIASSLTEGEIVANVAGVVAFGSEAAPRLRYSTAADNASAIRAAYKTATRLEAVMIGDYLATLIDAELRNAFSLTQQQVTTLRDNRLTPAANIAALIRANAGA